ncbi:MAG: KH domain-containing protein [Candidatus Eremiobacteraeota bacterium]|nr:KH domain-containing protein [Candidatus Eremiobacteraeota bacterium]MBV8459263.1 KH domain-containing protein [Candidatus Eremiobacteraeota bacterium]MBV8596748.1 KH domain-containing protein [Candidatus Eremiobacteraeota bacterium]
MHERPPDFVDLDEEEPLPVRQDTDVDQAPVPLDNGEPADDLDEAEAADDEPGPEGDEEADDVIGRAAAVLKYIVEHIVDDPNQISIGATSDDRGPVLLLSVSDDDRGKVIGRQGRIVQAIRTIVKAATVGTGERVNVEIVD